VNIDTHTKTGIQRAKELHLIQSGIVDMVISPYFVETLDLFDPSNKARLFTIFRHPVHRIANIFYLQHGRDSDVSIEEFVNRPDLENNWMVRYLVNKREGAITGNDLELAKEILRRKFVVGLFEHIWEAIDRFDGYFGWVNDQHGECRDGIISDMLKRHEYNMLEIGSPAWNTLLDKNYFDMMLYNYAQILYEEQHTLFSLYEHFH